MKAVWLLVAFSGLGWSAAAEVVYLKRSELTAFALGQQAGQAAAQVANVRSFSAHRQAGYARLDELRRELAACGGCSRRDGLMAEISEVQAAQLREDRIMCGTWNSLGFSDPSIDAVKKLTGYGAVCDRFNQEAGIVEAERKNKQNKVEFAQRVKAGDLSAYVWMGRRTFTTNRHLSYDDQAALACPYYAEGARRGVDMAAIFFAQECFGAGAAERSEGYEMLKGCAPKSAACANEQAQYHETTRRTNVSWPVAADDREALRIYEQALRRAESDLRERPGDQQLLRAAALSRDKINEVRARIDGGTQAPAAPAAAPLGTPAPTAVGEGAGVADRADTSVQPSTPSAPPAGVARAPRERVDPMQRRCENLLRAVERNQAAAVTDPARYASRLASAQAQYQRACGG